MDLVLLCMMRNYFTSIIFSFVLSLPAFGQLEVSDTHHSFGNLGKRDKTTVDFLIKNKGNEEVHLLRATAVRHIDVRYTSRTIKPDSTVMLRIHYNPRKKGVFTERIHVFVSLMDQPQLTFTIDGRVNFEPTGEGTPCPDFNLEDEYSRLDFPVDFTVIDSMTKAPIKGAKVEIIQNGRLYGRSFSDGSGHTNPVVRTGPYFFVVTVPGYKPKQFDRYMNKANRKLNIHMVPAPTLEPEIPVAVIEDPVNDVVIEIPVDVPPESTDTITEVVVQDTTELDRSKYKANNIVFLIDVSTSMKQKGRLDLLKASMIELLGPMRDIDNIAIVTYSSGARVEMQSRPATNKEAIISIIENLKAGGTTEGGKGLRQAYAVARKNFIEGGNNQVIIATDGAFSDTETNHAGIVGKNAKRGIRMSVVGMVNERWTEKSMKAMAANGQGHYLRIEDYQTSRAILLEEIKLNSKVD